MSLLTLIIIAISLGIDSFVALWAIGASSNCQRKRTFIRLSLLVGAFHFFMPLVGNFFSSLLIDYIQSYAVYISAVIFALLGFNMIKEAFKEEPPVIVINLSKAILLSYALSIDALVAGFSLSLIPETYSIYIISSVFAVGAFLMSYIGYYMGCRCSHWNTRYSSIISGLILIALGVKQIL